MIVLGWDIGGVNTKLARVDDGHLSAVVTEAYELQHSPAMLAPLLREMAKRVEAEDASIHAITMTAELSQMFRTKREGVSFVLDGVEAAFPDGEIQVYSTNGRFLSPLDARSAHLEVAAANWAATAALVATAHQDAVLVDVGTTTTDIIPIVDHAECAIGRTDPGRLASGELVYLGALRTPVEAVLSEVRIDGQVIRVSAEGFALVGDAHLLRGDLTPEAYSVPTPDRRPATPEFARERLARVVCADRDMITHDAISAIANQIADAQVERVTAALRQVRARHRTIKTAVVTGFGSFIGAAAAKAADLEVVPLSETLGSDGQRCAPAAASALLLAGRRAQPEKMTTNGN